MILWTIADLDTVTSQATVEAEPPLENAVVDGVPVLVRRTPEGARTIDRVLSTDPYHFLRPELAPGRTLYLQENTPPQATKHHPAAAGHASLRPARRVFGCLRT